MRDLDIKRLNSIAEELEKRVYRLESQPKKTESEIIEENGYTIQVIPVWEWLVSE